MFKIAPLAVAASLAIPTSLAAQTFKAQKWDIGGEGNTDYVNAEPGTGRVFVSRSSHVMVVDGPTGRVLGDIQNTPRMHGIALAEKWHHGFISNAGDSTVTMFDLQSLRELRRIKISAGGLDGIMYDDFSDHIILTNHSRPIGTLVALDANSGDIVGTVNLDDSSPEGAASDGKGKIFVNLEGTGSLQVIDERNMTSLTTWSIAPCEGPTGIAYDRATDRVISGCSGTSVVVDPGAGKVVATIANGNGVDALGWDPGEKLIYIPNGRDGNVTIARQDSANQYRVIATVETVTRAKTIAVDPVTHNAYLFQPEFAPAPAGSGRGVTGAITAAWFVAITH
jgi:DNA-binding beta-propeller fold protein YncE